MAVLPVEHIRPRRHGGSDHGSNLSLARIDCNLHKGPNLTGIGPATQALTELFHPRRQEWEEHFAWEGIFSSARRRVGRTTVQVLAVNSEDQLALRSAAVRRLEAPRRLTADGQERSAALR